MHSPEWLSELSQRISLMEQAADLDSLHLAFMDLREARAQLSEQGQRKLDKLYAECILRRIGAAEPSGLHPVLTEENR